MIYSVDAYEAINNWPRIRKQLLRVFKRVKSGFSEEDILTCVQTGRMQVWRSENWKGISVTEIQTFPRFKVLMVFQVAGEDLRDWLTDGQQQLDQFALKNGCAYVDFVGRPGWERLCESLGYSTKMIWMRKELRPDDGHGCEAERDRRAVHTGLE